MTPSALSPSALLAHLTDEFVALHTKVEHLMWVTAMGDHSQDDAYDASMNAYNARCGAASYDQALTDALTTATETEKESLERRQHFFRVNRVSPEAKKIQEEITLLDTHIHKRMSEKLEGYTDPKTGEFIKASRAKMRLMMATDPDAEVRKACFDGIQHEADHLVDDYITLVNLNNSFARAQGYKNFYEYRTQTGEGISVDELFAIFKPLEIAMKKKFAEIRELEKEKPGLRDPRNFGYMMTGNFAKLDEPYFPLEGALEQWLDSYSAWHIDFRGATMTLDLLERDGKFSNGFCHLPSPAYYKDGKRVPAAIGFTTIAIPGQLGSGRDMANTLFHEGGHAAHFANMDSSAVIDNTENMPQSTAVAEIQSMFLDTAYSSIERRTRYAKNAAGESYPRSLYEQKIRALRPLAGRDMLSMLAVMNFERSIYEATDLTHEQVVAIAAQNSLDYFDRSEPYFWILGIIHIYSAGACYYHNYALATLGLTQRRAHFYETDGYIVDNPHIGPAMAKVRALGAKLNCVNAVKLATGKDFSADAYIKETLMTADEILAVTQKRIDTTNQK